MNRWIHSQHLFFVVLIIFFLSSCIHTNPAGNNNELLSSEDWQQAVVQKVVDGDTVILETGEKVRLIGINAPEMAGEGEPYAQEAANWLKQQVAGKFVYLQKDVSDTDQYGRLLRYLWTELPEEITDEAAGALMINVRMIADGYAQPYTFPPDVMFADLIMNLARDAHRQERGLWAIDPDGTTRGSPLY